MNSLEELSAKFRLDLNNQAVYNYFKNKLGLVNAKYARKVLGVGEVRFKKIAEQYKLEVTELPAPNLSFKTKLYDLKKVREVRDSMQAS